MSYFSVTNDRVEVDVLIALIYIGLEETGQEFDLSVLISWGFMTFALLLLCHICVAVIVTQSGRLENDLVSRLFHIFYFFLIIN